MAKSGFLRLGVYERQCIDKTVNLIRSWSGHFFLFFQGKLCVCVFLPSTFFLFITVSRMQGSYFWESSNHLSSHLVLSFGIDLEWCIPQALASLNVSSGSSPSMTSSLSRSSLFQLSAFLVSESGNTNRIFHVLLVDRGQFWLGGASRVVGGLSACLNQGQIRGRSRLLRLLSHLVLKTSKRGDWMLH